MLQTQSDAFLTLMIKGRRYELNYRILYCSRSLLHGSEQAVDVALRQLLETARAGNRLADVTGALLCGYGAFAQVLEGSKPAVTAVYDKIRADPRHTDVLTLEQAYQPVRYFSGWSMAYVEPRPDWLQSPILDLSAIRSAPHSFAESILQTLIQSVAQDPLSLPPLTDTNISTTQPSRLTLRPSRPPGPRP